MPFMPVQQAIQELLLVGGMSDKNFFEIESKIKAYSSWILSRMDPLLNLLCKTCFSFLSDSVEITIRKAAQSSKGTTLITWQVLALSSLHLHMIWKIEHCWFEVKACGENTRLELCCHHNWWDIVLQADAAQMNMNMNGLGVLVQREGV